MHGAIMACLLVMGLIFGSLAIGAARKVSKAQAEPEAWFAALALSGVLMIATWLCNAMAFAKIALIKLYADEGVGAVDLVREQGALFLGTGSLMWIVIKALEHPDVVRESSPNLGACRAAVVIAERILPRFWLAVAGVGAVFGFAAGPGVVLLLAAELTFCWVIGHMLLRQQRRLSNRRPTESGS